MRALVLGLIFPRKNSIGSPGRKYQAQIFCPVISRGSPMIDQKVHIIAVS